MNKYKVGQQIKFWDESGGLMTIVEVIPTNNTYRYKTFNHSEEGKHYNTYIHDENEIFATKELAKLHKHVGCTSYIVGGDLPSANPPESDSLKAFRIRKELIEAIILYGVECELAGCSNNEELYNKRVEKASNQLDRVRDKINTLENHLKPK